MASLVVTLGVLAVLFLVHFNTVLARDEWDGIICYSGLKANKKMCSSCVTVYDDNSIIKRDCYESLSESEEKACESSSDVKCDRCYDALCNQGHPKHKCISCDSSSDARCTNNAKSIEPEQCVFGSTSLDDFYCYVKYDSSTGTNKRGCVTTTQQYSDCVHKDGACKLCIATDDDSENACADVFPKNRRKCIRCDSAYGKCPTQREPGSTDQHSIYCTNVADSCVVISRSKGSYNFVQMCSSDMRSDEKTYCQNNPSRCSFCSNADNCNLKGADSGTTEGTTAKPTTPTTSRPSNGHHQFTSNSLLLAIFIIISILIVT